MSRVETSILIRAPREAVFAFHEDPRNLTRVLPAYLRLEIIEAPPKLRRGAHLKFVMYVGPLRFDWHLTITEHVPPHRFVNVQEEGPFQSYVHSHVIEAMGDGTRLTDLIEYELPQGPFVDLASRIGFQSRLQDVLEHGQKITQGLLERRR